MIDLKTDNNIEIVNALPHKSPFVMVDELCFMNKIKASAKLFINENNIFVKNGFFQEPGIIEHIAQSAALRPTILALKAGKKVPLGYFSAINNLNIYKLPPVNSVIETTVTTIVEIKTATKVSTISKCQGELVCKSEMLFHLSN